MVWGIPLDLGKDNTGTDTGPDFLRRRGLLRMLEQTGISYRDLGNVPCPRREGLAMGDKRVKYLAPIVEVVTAVASCVREEVGQGRRVIALGGDHSISLGTISGAALSYQGELGLIYIDAHPDAMTDENSLSGNIHGMVTSALLGFGHSSLVNILQPGPKIKPERLLFIGIKDLDQGEIDFIQEHHLTAFSPLDIDLDGLRPVAAAIDQLAKRVKNIWISFDIDSVDSHFAPATPMSSAGGLTYREIDTLSKYIGKRCNVVGMDIVECMPAGEVGNKTASTAISVAAHLLGAQYGWYTHYIEQEATKQRFRE